MTRAATPKLKTYIALAGWGLFLGVATGRIELLVLAAPFFLSIVLGAVIAPPPNVDVVVTIHPHRCIEGDEVIATVELSSEHHWSEIEVALALPPGLELAEGHRTATLSLDAGSPTRHQWRLVAQRWGAHPLGVIALRLHGPGRLTVFESLVDQHVILKVYPSHDRLLKSIPPLDTQIYSGNYVSRASGDGIEFANVRPFVAGDSVRRVNWRVTSRRNALHVNLAQPERDADLVLFLDTFSQADLGGRTTLDLTVRGASVLARHHLQHADRIGLVSFGGSLRWLTASMGRTHAYRVADFLIDVNTTFSFVWKDIELLPHGTLPPRAMVVAFSSLVDERSFKALVDINHRGFPVVVINTLVESLVRPTDTAEGRVAYRAWVMQREMKRDRLIAAGIPVVDWTGAEPIQGVLALLPSRRRRVRI